MTETTFDLSVTQSPATLTIRGHIDGAVVAGLAEAVAGWSPVPETGLIIDVRGCESYEPDARPALVEVHKALAEKTRRRVYLAVNSRLRGLALWVSHMACDTLCRAVGTEAQAERWLQGEMSRIETDLDRLGATEMPARARTGSIRRDKLSFSERVSVRALGWIVTVTDGYWPDFTEEMVRTYGPEGLKAWGDAVGAGVKKVTETYGDEVAQGLFAMAAVWNGCAYCTTGHFYALNILYFKRTGRLFPIDEREVARWYTLTDERLVERVLERLADDEHAQLSGLFRRQFEIRVKGAELEPEPEDDFIQTANAAFDLINECSIVIDSAKVPPLNPKAAKMWGVQRAYAQKRGRKRGRRIDYTRASG